MLIVLLLQRRSFICFAQMAMAVLPRGRRGCRMVIPVRHLLLGHAAPPRLVLEHRCVLRLSFTPYAPCLPLYGIDWIPSIVRAPLCPTPK